MRLGPGRSFFAPASMVCTRGVTDHMIICWQDEGMENWAQRTLYSLFIIKYITGISQIHTYIISIASDSHILQGYAQAAGFCPSEHGAHLWRLSPAGTGGYKTGRSVPFTLFFNKLHYRCRLCSYINHFRNIREPSLVRLSPSGLFFCTSKHGMHFGCSNQHLNTRKKQGITGPLFSFSIEYIVSIN